MKLHYLPLLTIIVLNVSCFRQDIRTITVNTPQMKSPECAKIVQTALQADGILTNIPNTETGTIQVTYDAKTLAIKNIEFLIAGAGFDANDTQAPAEIRAALPEGCR